MRKITLGILAHVDAGKTTLSESLLYLSGAIRKKGRVDNKDAFLDTYALEKERGITIFSKQAMFTMGDMEITLLDTPGHVDFSAEMERTLQVLDYAVLVISGADGVQGHTQTLWRLLKQYEIPVFLFINKMDQPGTDVDALMEDLKRRLDGNCVNFTGNPNFEELVGLLSEETLFDSGKNGKKEKGQNKIEAGFDDGIKDKKGRSFASLCETHRQSDDFLESLAVCEESVMEHYLESGEVSDEEIQSMIQKRLLFPCFFGSALKMFGVEMFMNALQQYMKMPSYPERFGAKIFKISRDEQGNRLTYLKVTGGALKVKTLLKGIAEEEPWEEKVNQIRVYSGSHFEPRDVAESGCICAVTGLTKTRPGECLGNETNAFLPVLEPVLTYRIELPPECDVHKMIQNLRQLEEEEPQLHIVWNEQLGEIHAKLMGEVQTDILRTLIWERFGVHVRFGTGNIVYKETIANVVEGVGHYEPLRHYSEVHLVLEPGERGSGLQFAACCSEDVLDRNWQRLIMTHLEEKEHIGVLTGSPITDMKITLTAGKAHLKHTEGGDFRQSTYRAIRQGLKMAESILLEPVYEFRLEVPSEMLGRAMSDVQKMYGEFEPPQQDGEFAILKGTAPVSTMQDYQKEVISYSRGRGRLFCTLKGYEPCHNQEEVVEAIGYDSEHDLENPTGSVFCAHGAGFVVPWDQVRDYMHLEGTLDTAVPDIPAEDIYASMSFEERERHFQVTEDELQEIFHRTYGAMKQERTGWKAKRKISASTQTTPHYRKPQQKLKEYLLVDGYNIIFAWEELQKLAKDNIDSARDKLMDILCAYQSFRGCTLILVFDAYKVKGGVGAVQQVHNIYVVYTKEAETADQYIEKTAHEMGRKYDVTVATSDGLEQVIILGQGCKLLSARDLKKEIERMNEAIREEIVLRKESGKNYLFDHMPKELVEEMEKIRLGKATGDGKK